MDSHLRLARYLALGAGKYIAPEVASRQSKTGNVQTGRGKMIHAALIGFLKSHGVEKRCDGEYAEWKLKDFQWANKVLSYIQCYA